MNKAAVWLGVFGIVALAAFFLSLGPRFDSGVPDDAKAAGKTAADFPQTHSNAFDQMDGGIALTPDEVKGRNMWIVWTGGDDKMWDTLTTTSVGTLDFLKTISSYPGLRAHRGNRFEYAGLINEPCFREATAANPDRYGLWLDTRDPRCPKPRWAA